MFTLPDWRPLDSLRRPAYTGENRCLPCTAANLVLAFALAAGVAVVSLPLGALVLTLSLASIYFRGYLVPGTPTLTKRYFPDSVLARFGKATETERTDRGERGPRLTTDLGAEGTLREAGALETVRVDGEDDADGTRLAPEFRRAWLDRLDSLDSVDVDDGVRAVFGDDAATTPVGDDLATVVDGQRLVGWESTAALRAAIAASETLAAQWDHWAEIPGPERQRLLSTLRAYLDQCPDCGGTVELTETRRESCCRATQRTVTTRCGACEATVLDVNETV